MCVAIHVPGGVTRPSLEDMKKMETSNPHGAGIGWFDPDTGRCRWIKGLSAEGVQAVMERLDSDFALLIHFRWASAGDRSKGLCHPFPIGAAPDLANGKPDVKWDLAEEGEADEIMIHNGHWSSWERWKPKRLPGGPWSDTRLAAYLADIEPTILHELGGKVAVMNRFRTTLIGYWTEEHNVYYSNTSWRYSGTGSMYSGGSCGPGHQTSLRPYSVTPEPYVVSGVNGVTGGTTTATSGADAKVDYDAQFAARRADREKAAGIVGRTGRVTQPVTPLNPDVPTNGAKNGNSVSGKPRNGSGVSQATVRSVSPDLDKPGPFYVKYEGQYGFARMKCDTPEQVEKLMAMDEDKFVEAMFAWEEADYDWDAPWWDRDPSEPPAGKGSETVTAAPKYLLPDMAEVQAQLAQEAEYRAGIERAAVKVEEGTGGSHVRPDQSDDGPYAEYGGEG